MARRQQIQQQQDRDRDELFGGEPKRPVSRPPPPNTRRKSSGANGGQTKAPAPKPPSQPPKAASPVGDDDFEDMFQAVVVKKPSVEHQPSPMQETTPLPTPPPPPTVEDEAPPPLPPKMHKSRPASTESAASPTPVKAEQQSALPLNSAPPRQNYNEAAQMQITSPAKPTTDFIPRAQPSLPASLDNSSAPPRERHFSSSPSPGPTRRQAHFQAVPIRAGSHTMLHQLDRYHSPSPNYQYTHQNSTAFSHQMLPGAAMLHRFGSAEHINVYRASPPNTNPYLVRAAGYGSLVAGGRRKLDRGPSPFEGNDQVCSFT